MKTVFIGGFVEPSSEEYIRHISNGAFVSSATAFQKAFLKGFGGENLKIDYIVNAPPVGNYPQMCKKVYIRKNNFLFNQIEGVSCGFLNLAFVKRWFISKSIFRVSKKWIGNQGNDEVLIILYSLLPAYLEAAVKLKNYYKNTKICCIVPDLPNYFSSGDKAINRFLNIINSKAVFKLVPNIDLYVLLTEEMRYPLKIEDKPWLLLEGIYEDNYNENEKNTNIDTPIIKSILYSGTLDSRFGITKLVEAFSAIPDKDAKLIICGPGSEKDLIIEKSKEDKRISYLGILPRKDVLKLQRRVSLLVNPRGNKDDYTKFSFPSKTMEYLASGTPVAMYDLPGMPREYVDYLLLFPDDSIKSMTDVLVKGINMSKDERESFGSRARRFILCNKTSKSQIYRFSKFIKDNL